MNNQDDDLFFKYERLKDYLESLKSVAVAFSSGVDSTFLLCVAREVLRDNVIAITASAPFIPERELEEAKAYCDEIGVKHIIFKTDEKKIDGFSDNPKNRCYVCKKALFEGFLTIAKDNNISVVIEGSNLDDNSDYRPGLKAIEELNIKSPLRHIGFTKEDIRILSKKLKLNTWNKPSYACLASRFVYGEKITNEKLLMVDRAEQLLIDLGFKQMRVRIHGTLARIEVTQDEFERLISKEIRTIINDKFRALGFSYITMDLLGYRTGSMNETL